MRMVKDIRVMGLAVAAAALLAAGCTAAGVAIASPAQRQAANAAAQTARTQAQATAQPVPVPVPGLPRSITVVGVGKANGTPDVANVTVGVETAGNSVQQAVTDNNTQMTALIAALRELDIADEDIMTSNYSVYTERQPGPMPADTAITGTVGAVTYRVSNQVQVTVRDVTKLSGVLDAVVAAGANSIYGVNFSVGDTSQLEGDARTAAMADAKARAESLANLAGVTLGEVVSVSELVGGPGPVAYSARAEAAGGGAPIQPGTLEMNLSVQVTYAISD